MNLMTTKLTQILTVFAILFALTTNSHAYEFYWSGNYRAEVNYLDNLDLSASGDDKTYALHHLFLQPELILLDGFSLHMGLDVLNGDGSLPPSHRLGQFFGGSLSSDTVHSNFDMPAALVQRNIQRTREVNFTEFYLKYSHTNGELTLGRAPLHFGLGMTYNAGHELFDHWYTNRDMIAYRFKLFGSSYITPIVARLGESTNLSSDDINEFGGKFEFNVEETGLEMGIMALFRNTPKDSNASASVIGAQFGDAKTRFYNFFVKRTYPNFYYGLEVGLNDGTIGEDSVGNEVDFSGVGAAAEVYWTPGKLKLGSKFGFSSGNDTADTLKYNGYGFHRNYNLGLMLFNHPTGDSSYDPLGTSVLGRNGSLQPADYEPHLVADTDRISNTIYFAPEVSYSFTEKWNLQGLLVTAWLAESEIGAQKVSSYLGSEIDLTLTYKPIQNVTWKTTLGFLLPGKAFKGPTNSFDDKIAYGATTGFGISF